MICLDSDVLNTFNYYDTPDFAKCKDYFELVQNQSKTQRGPKG